jgi:hypothetical protein
MKTIKRVIVQPELDNPVRKQVNEWCEKTFGPKYGNDGNTWMWNETSNYDRSKYASFDVHFKHPEHATLFVLKWGGKQIIESEGSEVDSEIFNNLFE